MKYVWLVLELWNFIQPYGTSVSEDLVLLNHTEKREKLYSLIQRPEEDFCDFTYTVHIILRVLFIHAINYLV
jgi:hypothetical protein